MDDYVLELFVLVNLLFFVCGIALGIAIESWRRR